MGSRSSNPQLVLSNELLGIIHGWASTGWPGLTDTTYQLFRYWFNRDINSQRFHICQQRAIETIVYCHEILQIRSLHELFTKVCPDVLNSSQAFLEEAQGIGFPKYCLKMATGTGKTWVLIALLIWQYFNSQNQEKPRNAEGKSREWYSDRFLLVAPGREVLDRLLDAFKGKRDSESGLRNPSTADYLLPLMMPQDWRSRFNMQIFEPSEIRSNTQAPEGPFMLVTNWQQFVMKRDAKSIWEELTGAEVHDELPRGEFLVDFLSEFPSLVIMNDEAHHVHSGKTANREELVWRKFINKLHNELKERHIEDKGLFVQYDFSATPFFGSGTQKQYFVHIVYDYDLVEAMHAMLVKQLFLEKRIQLAVENLDFKAVRKKPESGKKHGDIVRLSQGQLLMLEIGRQKLESLAIDFQSKGIDKKPVMMVLCEETEVAKLVKERFKIFCNQDGSYYDELKVMQIHTDMKDAELEVARRRLDKIDDNSDPLNVVISVLMLREGFDRKNICVIVVLRATEADLLLEQIVGRGLRLMFPRTAEDSVWQLKEEAMTDILNNRKPKSSFDCLFIVEHPRFETFYQRLREEGYLIGIGDTSKIKPTGDIIVVDAIPHRIRDFDISWPVQIFEQGTFPDITTIDVSKLPKYNILSPFADLRNSMGHITIQDVHYDSGKRTETWRFDTAIFSYNMFLLKASKAIAKEGKTTILSGHLSEIAQLVDEYTSEVLFGEQIDFEDPKNCLVLNNVLIFDFIIDQIRRAILLKLGQLRYQQTGKWMSLSDVSRINLREKNSIETWRTIYSRQGFSAKGGGFERDFMREVLENSSQDELISYAKLDKRHRLLIPYRDEYGILREYEVDFIIKTNNKIFLVETKADKDLNDPAVMLKAKAAHAWCMSASKVPLLNDKLKSREFEYLVLPEGLFKANRSLGFGMFIPLCREVRNHMIATFDNTFGWQKRIL